MHVLTSLLAGVETIETSDSELGELARAAGCDVVTAGAPLRLERAPELGSVAAALSESEAARAIVLIEPPPGVSRVSLWIAPPGWRVTSAEPSGDDRYLVTIVRVHYALLQTIDILARDLSAARKCTTAAQRRLEQAERELAATRAELSSTRRRTAATLDAVDAVLREEISRAERATSDLRAQGSELSSSRAWRFKLMVNRMLRRNR